MDDNHRPVLLCYDGSDGSKAALEAVAQLFPGREVIVACYWEPFAESSKRMGIDILELIQDAERINAREEELSRTAAEEGAEVLREAGLVPEPLAVKIHGSMDDAILAHAEELDASAIVLGSRGHASLRSLILGDVANEILQRATRPVLVVPSPDLARRRRLATTDDVRA
jgi:nucleotide-binding universal stress UspA family protein